MDCILVNIENDAMKVLSTMSWMKPGCDQNIYTSTSYYKIFNI